MTNQKVTYHFEYRDRHYPITVERNENAIAHELGGKLNPNFGYPWMMVQEANARIKLTRIIEEETNC